jgi:hypothetical protein
VTLHAARRSTTTPRSERQQILAVLRIHSERRITRSAASAIERYVNSGRLLDSIAHGISIVALIRRRQQVRMPQHIDGLAALGVPSMDAAFGRAANKCNAVEVERFL